MTYFYIDGQTFTKACNRNKGLMAKAKDIFVTQGKEAAEKYIKEHTQNGFRVRKTHDKDEDIQGRRKALNVSASFMARLMGYSVAFYCSVERKESNYSESFYDKFIKSERKLKRLFGKQKRKTK